MAQAPAYIESVIAVAHAPDLGRDVYTNASPLDLQAGARSLRGSILVAQAISAASATVPESYLVTSSQSSFLNPTNARDKLVYRVERTVEGRKYATRIVRAEQNATLVYIATLSFQNYGSSSSSNVLIYGLPMPALDGSHPDDVDKDAMQAMQSGMVDKGASITQISADDLSLDWRPLGLEMAEDPSRFRLRGFVRSPARLSATASPAVHLAAFGFASDEMSVGPALAANPLQVGRGFKNVALLASLTHNVSFHEPGARIDDWVVLERDTTWGAHGRVLISQRMWDMKTGRLVMTVSQEALILLKPKKAKI
ncbi:hypothetical protein PG993_008997 [Apiospora rasikravindrae]|uniref:Acyl-CoA thioesterase II n=1 Tax=Apiospora rasikravindrae TaxID=990691 RepID=A0ABR1SI63_9PEZI